MPSEKRNQGEQKQDRERTGESQSDLKEREYRGPTARSTKSNKGAQE